MKLNEDILRIAQIMGINENNEAWFRRRFETDELQNLVQTIKDQISDGESLDTAIYDTIRDFISSKNFKDINDDGTEQEYWDSYILYEKPLLSYVKKKLNYD